MKTLLLGGTGFVGKSILNWSSGNDLLGQITICSRNRPSNLPTGIEFESWDLLQSSTLDPKYDLIIHAGTPALIDFERPVQSYEATMTTTRNLIEFIERFSSPPRLLFTSSGAVYGELTNETNAIKETWNRSYEPDPRVNPYARGKIDSESLFKIADQEGKCHLSIARLFAFSGPNLPLDKHFAIGNFVRDAVEFRKITVRGDGSPIRSYLDSRDMAKWLTRIALFGTATNPYHVGSETPISIGDLAKKVARLAGQYFKIEVPIEILGKKSSSDGVTSYVPSTSTTREELKVSEEIQLDESIRTMLDMATS